VLEERRRIARDLHDGLAQELAFIVLEAGGASSAASPPETLRRIAAAAERATMEVRLVVAAFIEPLDSSVLPSLQKTAREAAKRYADLRIETTGADFDVSSVEREALHWITREAVSNAVRHGHAANVRLRVTSTPSRRLRVVDDGGGFDPATHGDGFGITIMSARAVRAGGSLSVRSLRGVGTAVQIVLPTLEPAKRARDRREPAGALPR